jgi:carbon-monoxide dehydrogenase medium subunit/6-hydroxypseudooxynicotine dehydrogenase subunit alpha
VKAPPFAYARAGSLDEALSMLREAGDEAKLLAGGQSLVPLLVYRVVRPTHLVDIDALGGGLAGLARDEEKLELGALMRHETLARAELLGAECLLAQAAAQIGHVPIRVRGTLGGSVAHADPAAELPLALLALDAEIQVRSASGGRAVPAAGFFLGPFTTALAADEAVVAVTVPAAARSARSAFGEFAVRSGDFALAAAGVVAHLDDGRATAVRIALAGVAATPVRALEAESRLEGAELTDEAIDEAARAAAAGCDPAEDATTTASYRRTLVARLTRDALRRLRGSTR